MFKDQTSDEFSAYGLKVQNIQEIDQIQSQQNLKTMRIMHSDQLQSMRGLEIFAYLHEINLSSNSIERIEGLQNAQDLCILNLSCNKIRAISGNIFTNCKKLLKLNLSHNKITQLTGLSYMRGDAHSLQWIDLRNNKIENLKELSNLDKIDSLREVLLNTGKQFSNPVCNNKNAYYNFILNFENILDRVDQKTMAEIKNEIPEPENLPQQVYKQEIISNDKNDKNIEKIIEMENDQKELINKFEENQKYWGEKCEQLNEELNNQTAENRDKQAKIRQLQGQIQQQNEQLSEIKSQNNKFSNKNEKKEQLVENLQIRLTDLLKENGEYHRELVLRQDEIQKYLQEQREYQKKQSELKGQLKENEKILQSFHNQALESANSNLLRNEDMRKKYETIYEENHNLQSENSNLKQRVSELLDLCREWEFKFEKKIDEYTYRSESDKRNYELEKEKIQREINEFYSKEIDRNNQQFKENMDMLENEFKKVLMENNEKFRQLKSAFEEKSRSESDSRQMIKVTLQKNQEYEQNQQELQYTLLKLKREVSDIVSEKEIKQSELEHKLRQTQMEYEKINEEKNRYQQEKMKLERQNSDLQEQNVSEHIELERLRQKTKIYEGLEGDLEEIQSNLNAKNKMLDDQNDTIEEQRVTIDIMRKNEGQTNDEYSKILKKYEKQNQIIEELEDQIQQTQQDNDIILKDLQEKKEIIFLFEQEIHDVREKQDKDIGSLKHELKEKEKKMIDLLDLLDECKDSLKMKDGQIQELEKISQDFNVRIKEKDNINRQLLEQKETESKNLEKKYREAQQDMILLIQEVDRQKKAAKENLEKLNILFNQ